MRRVKLFLTLIVIIFLKNETFSQNYLYHSNNRLEINKSLKDFKKGDTLTTFDSLWNMKVVALYKKGEINSNISLTYSNQQETEIMTIKGYIKDSNLYWNGKCTYTNKSLHHSNERFYIMNVFQGITVYFEWDKIKRISSINNGNNSDVYIDRETGKLKYYFLADSLNTPNGIQLSFHKNGELFRIGRNLSGKREGEWKYYDLIGELVKTEFYNYGAIKRTKISKKYRRKIKSMTNKEKKNVGLIEE